MQPRNDTDKADAEVAVITKFVDYSFARSRHMHKRSMPDGILTGQASTVNTNDDAGTITAPTGWICNSATISWNFTHYGKFLEQQRDI